jgi:hypothetical protein
MSCSDKGDSYFGGGVESSYFGGEVSSPYFGGDVSSPYFGGAQGGYISSGLMDYSRTNAGLLGKISTGIAVAVLLFYIIVTFVLIMHEDAQKFRVIGWCMLAFAGLSLLRLAFIGKDSKTTTSTL